MEIEPFVDAEGAAEFLRINRRRLLGMARNGSVPAHPIGNGKRKTWRFRLSELEKAITKPRTDVGNRDSAYDQKGRSLAVPKKKGR